MLPNEELRMKSDTRAKFFLAFLVVGESIVTQICNMNMGLEVSFDRAKCSAQLLYHVVPS